jgi:5,10-methenyltetrahydromethanopterin hydrogenase
MVLVWNGQGKVDKDLIKNYLSCVGTGAFICKSNTKFTTEWYIKLNKNGFYYEDLKKNLGNIKGRNAGYLIFTSNIITNICTLCLIYYCNL